MGRNCINLKIFVHSCCCNSWFTAIGLVRSKELLKSIFLFLVHWESDHHNSTLFSYFGSWLFSILPFYLFTYILRKSGNAWKYVLGVQSRMYFVFMQQLRAQYENKRWLYVCVCVMVILANQRLTMNLCCPRLFVWCLGFSFIRTTHGWWVGSYIASSSWINSCSHIFRIYIKAHARDREQDANGITCRTYIHRQELIPIKLSESVSGTSLSLYRWWSKVIIKVGPALKKNHIHTHIYPSIRMTWSITIHHQHSWMKPNSKLQRECGRRGGEGVSGKCDEKKSKMKWNDIWWIRNEIECGFQTWIWRFRFYMSDSFFIYCFGSACCPAPQPCPYYYYCPPLALLSQVTLKKKKKSFDSW